MSFPAPRPGRRRLAGPARLRPGTGRGEAHHRLGSLTLTKVRAGRNRGGWISSTTGYPLVTHPSTPRRFSPL